MAVSPGTLTNYEGRYEIDPAIASGIVFTVIAENGRLFVKRAQSTSSTELHALSDTRFFIVEDQLEITFGSDASGAISEIQSNRGWTAKRIGK